MAEAGDTSELWLCSPRPERRIATNRDVGLVVDLGTFDSGTELVFCIVNLNTGWRFFMGPADRNPDGIAHAIVDVTGPGVAEAGFEDLLGGGDRDFNDNRFRFTGVVSNPPVAADDGFETDEDVTLSVPPAGVLANDFDADGDQLTALLVSGPANGAVTLNPDGSFSYQPTANWHGTDTFTYKANDGQADSNVATVTITVTPVNDVPVAADDGFETAEDVTLSVPLGGVLANDTDADGDQLTTLLVSGPANGAVSLNPDGSFSYTPTANCHGTDTFTYKANDGQADSNVATVTITVTPVNDVPVAADDEFETDEDVTLSVPPAGVLANDIDADGDQLTALLVSGPATGT